MNPDVASYHRFTSKARLHKSLMTLTGIIEGIGIDRKINAQEVSFLNDWVVTHADVANRHPYSELVPWVADACHDGVLTEEERDDIFWLCMRLLDNTDYYDAVTTDLQRLHGILGGMLADARLTENELSGLQEWLHNHENLKMCWPYDELDTLVTAVLADGTIDEDEHHALLVFFADLVSIDDCRVLSMPLIRESTSLTGLCATSPEIHFPDSLFCFTGASAQYTRKELGQMVQHLGGVVSPRVNKQLNYLIIGADGNPCWAYACYGRKIEQAVQLRKQGHRLALIYENDFHAAVANFEG